MNKLDIEVFLLTFCIVVACWIICLAFDTLEGRAKNLREQVISLGYAEYNSTNGNWQWKTNSIK